MHNASAAVIADRPAQDAASSASSIRVEPAGPGVGARITGVDLSRELNEVDFGRIRDALHEYSVVVLPGQHFTPAQQVVFTKRLGQLRTSFYNRYGVPDCPELSVVSNIRNEKGEAIGIEDAGMLWHTDASYLKAPDMYSVLYGIEIPHADGKVLGDTVFTSSYLAFEALPEELKARLKGLRAVHSFIYHLEKKAQAGNLKRAPLTEKQKAELPDMSHPVVRTHPVTSRPCLFVTEGHTSHIEGMSREESDALLARLAAHLADPRFHYRHKWTKGDLLIWDNCSAHHLAIFDYGKVPRRLHRAGVMGTAPY